MVYKCCVPLCRGNYTEETKVCVFQFPKDEETKKKWILAIPRKDFQPTKYSKVCIRHFLAEDVLHESSYFDEKSGKLLTVPMNRPKLKESAIPRVFPDCPGYLTTSKQTREAPSMREQRLESAAVEAALAESLKTQEAFEAEQKLDSFGKVISLVKLNKHSAFWDAVVKPGAVIFMHLEACAPPLISYSLIIDIHNNIKVYHRTRELKAISKFTLPFQASFMYEVYDMLDSIEKCENSTNNRNIYGDIIALLEECKNKDSENESLYNFIKSQISLVQEKKERLRYSCDIFVFAAMFYLISPQAYKFARNSGNLVLPHPVTIKRLCSSFKVGPINEQDEHGFLSYMKHRVSHLQSHERYVTLMMDEIHLKPFLDYKGGCIVGSAYNSSSLASSAHVFMVQSLLSSFKDVVHILPVSTLTACDLNDILKKVIIGLENVGLNVVCIISDNNSINRKAVSLFTNPPRLSIVYPHPFDHSRPLFYILDSVHIFKCIRNNWINQKNDGLCLLFPDFNNHKNTCTASFDTIRKLYTLESGKLLKYGYCLSMKAVWPTNMERQNVKLVQQIFNDYNIEALNSIGKENGLPHSEESAMFLSIISRWWKIMNVKTPNKGKRHNDIFLEPLTNKQDDHHTAFLKNFFSWLEAWGNLSLSTGCLTKETFTAIRHTTHAILELASFCFEELKLSYILPGKFQTDGLEARFGLYRQMAGAQYHLSVRQVFEVEQKLRMSNILANQTNEIASNIENILDSDEKYAVLDSFPRVDVTPIDRQEVSDDMPIIVYVAGYCAFQVHKKLNCCQCKDFLLSDFPLDISSSEFTSNLSRGGLHYPQQAVVELVLFNYVVLKKILSGENENKFIHFKNHRAVAIFLTRMTLESHEFNLMPDCTNGHISSTLMEKLLTCSTNCLINNFCKNKNQSTKKGSKRKLSTLSKT